MMGPTVPLVRDFCARGRGILISLLTFAGLGAGMTIIGLAFDGPDIESPTIAANKRGRQEAALFVDQHA